MPSSTLPHSPLFLHLQGRPAEYSRGPSFDWYSFKIPTISLHQPPRPLAVNFEFIAAQLQQLPRMFFEMDGSFVWTGSVGGTDWQLDGLVYDSPGLVRYVEVKGRLPYPQWLHFTQALGRDRQPLLAHLVDRGAFVDLDDFDTALWKPIDARSG